MQKWLAHLDFGVPTCSTYEVIEADSYEEACKQAYDLTIEWAQSYGYEQNEEYFGCLDELGCDWDEDAEEYEQTGFADPSVEPYDHELHYSLVH
jgi:hypothetical protein